MFLFILKLLTLLPLLKNVVLAVDMTEIVCSLFPPYSKSVSFLLYTKSVENFSITADEESVKNCPFIPNSNTVKLIVHGFGASSKAVNIVALRKAYINGPQNHNVLLVDYSNFTGKVSQSNVITHSLKYVQAVKCGFPKVVNAITEIIEMIQNLRPEITNVHMVGHSLGGQIIGQSGSHLKDKGKPVHRLSALDPAGPLFSTSCITAESGFFVDVYHTQIAGFKGATKPAGIVDIYVDNAVVQDGCLNEKVLECSHRAALLYFAESINNQNMKASRCDEIKTIVKNLDALKNIDKNNNNVLSSTCDKKSNSEGDQIVFGENISFNATGVYFIRIPTVPKID
ncbi:phospholipase A1-like isoform X2 [Adelges cooleyi]|uniref:phospholipase A1-like isoform X2 n=1 Tax=Adelges cooleyi TaxID=133065 RepID=UPI00217F5EF9|nr:phospholipase A1-like isoform X2 [Adelges cooleyi]